MSNYLLTNSVARLLGLSPDGVRRLERLGQLPAMRTQNGVRLFLREDVDRLIADREAARRRPTLEEAVPA